MAKEGLIEVEGVVKELMSNGFYKVEIQGGHEVLAHVKGKMKRFNIRILPGDHVALELSQYDLTKGRIIYRNKN